MQFAYNVLDLITQKEYVMIGNFTTYRHFVGELMALNMLWAGDLQFREIA